MSGQPPQDEYDDPTVDNEYMADENSENSEYPENNEDAQEQPEVQSALSAVAGPPGKSAIILIVIICILVGIVYMLFFSDDGKPEMDPDDPNAPAEIKPLPGPMAPSQDVVDDSVPPPEPELQGVQITPDIVLPDLPPLVPPAPPAPPQMRPGQMPGMSGGADDSVKFIIGNEALAGPSVPTVTDAQGNQAVNTKAISSLIGSGNAGGGGGASVDGAIDEVNIPTALTAAEGIDEILSNRFPGVTPQETAVATTIRNMNHTIAQGKLIEGALETAINTDLPGLVRALITRHVYAEQGGLILIPRGSRLIGNYESTVTRGQQRILVIWSRVIRPDGVDIAIESPGTDRLGRTGVEGDIDNKYMEIFGSAILISTITTGASIIADQFSDTDGVSTTENTDGSSRTTGSVSDIAVSDTAKQMGTIGKTLTEQLMGSNPTITVNQGVRINIFVNRDLVFPDDAAARYSN